jgi:hypothetical protein
MSSESDAVYTEYLTRFSKRRHTEPPHPEHLKIGHVQSIASCRAVSAAFWVMTGVSAPDTPQATVLATANARRTR